MLVATVTVLGYKVRCGNDVLGEFGVCLGLGTGGQWPLFTLTPTNLEVSYTRQTPAHPENQERQINIHMHVGIRWKDTAFILRTCIYSGVLIKGDTHAYACRHPLRIGGKILAKRHQYLHNK